MEEADFYILLKREYFWCRKHSFSNNGRRLRQSTRRNISSDAGPRLSEFDNVTTLSLVMIYEEIQRCFGNNDHVKVPWSYSPLSFAMTNEFKEMKRFFCVFKVVSKSRVWTAKLILFSFLSLIPSWNVQPLVLQKRISRNSDPWCMKFSNELLFYIIKRLYFTLLIFLLVYFSSISQASAFFTIRDNLKNDLCLLKIPKLLCIIHVPKIKNIIV